MKYGESAFDILYLLLAVICGILIIRRAHSKTGKLMGTAALILGFGDAFHLVPRVLNYFVDADLTAALGALIIVLYYQKRNVSRRFRYIWLYILLSFLFYLPVAVGAGAIPLLGMLMLPKTVCYILMICTFYSAAAKGETDL